MHLWFFKSLGMFLDKVLDIDSWIVLRFLYIFNFIKIILLTFQWRMHEQTHFPVPSPTLSDNI